MKSQMVARSALPLPLLLGSATPVGADVVEFTREEPGEYDPVAQVRLDRSGEASSPTMLYTNTSCNYFGHAITDDEDP